MSHNRLIGLFAFGCVVVGFLLGCWLSPRQRAVMTTHTRVDTVVVYQPQSASTKYKAIVDFSLPRILFAERVDTLDRAIIVADSASDKATVRVPIVTREYGDSTYRAVVSGPAIGDYAPTLDSVYIYNKYTTITQTNQEQIFRPYLGGGIGIGVNMSLSLEVGVLLKKHHLPKIGYTRLGNNDYITVGYGYLF